MRETTESWSYGQLFDAIANENSYAPHARAEVQRRATVAQEEALIAQKEAAEAQQLAAIAAKETAEYTKESAFYMRLSVYVLAASALMSALFSAWDHFVGRAG